MGELPKKLKGRKASEVFLEYCKPLLDDLADGTEEEFKKIEHCMKVPWTIWNSIILDEANKNNVMWMGSMKLLLRRFPQGDKILEFWIRRKVEEFSTYQYLMGDFSVVSTSKGAFTLKMESREP